MNDLQDTLIRGGATVVGFADLAPLDEEISLGFPRAVSIGIALRPDLLAGTRHGSTAECRAHVAEVYVRLGELAEQTVRELRSRGATAIAPDVTRQGRFSHKVAVTRSGLGWIGRSALAVLPQYGLSVRFVSVLTDAELPTGRPITKSRCGRCRACVASCPVESPSGRGWEVGVPTWELVDTGACRDHRAAELARTGSKGCYTCVLACPHTRAYLEREGFPL
jgi:epoxyqueuosine reductase QueG